MPAICDILFLSTLSLRRATYIWPAYLQRQIISIHALLAESDLRVVDGSKSSIISIHALLAESDDTSMPPTFIFSAFLSTLSLRRATMDTASKNRYLRFLSTLSLRRATRGEFVKREINRHFYPRSPCGERPRQKISIRQPHISIHALLAESDQIDRSQLWVDWNFYPRSPCGERQDAKRGNQSEHCISIHALLAESDLGNVAVGLHM